MLTDGAIIFARYAFMPNKLGYCGSDDNRTLFDYCAARHTDPGLVFLLQKFEAAYPYLKLIAGSNNIADPFDARVVEAYWLGNELLDRVDLVFDVHSRMGALDHSLDTMENCRIGWGRVKEIGTSDFAVEHQPLVMQAGKLKLGEPKEKRVLRQLDGTGFINSCQIGDSISFHWGWACEVLTPREVRVSS